MVMREREREHGGAKLKRMPVRERIGKDNEKSRKRLG